MTSHDVSKRMGHCKGIYRNCVYTDFLKYPIGSFQNYISVILESQRGARKAARRSGFIVSWFKQVLQSLWTQFLTPEPLFLICKTGVIFNNSQACGDGKLRLESRQSSYQCGGAALPVAECGFTAHWRRSLGSEYNASSHF